MTKLPNPRPEPTNKGLCQVYIFMSATRPPMQHTVVVPVDYSLGENYNDPTCELDDYFDLESIHCSCEGFAYGSECWHVRRAIELCVADDE